MHIRSFAATLIALAGCVSIAGCNRAEPLDYSGPVAGWDEAMGTKGGGQYSPLTQINRDNVERLEVAWTYEPTEPTVSTQPAGDAHGAAGKNVYASTVVETTPIIVDNRMVICTPRHRVVALDPATGRELWQYDPHMDHGNWLAKCRGVTSWQEPVIDNTKACQRRILSTSGDGRIVALDLNDGKPCQDFGVNGEISMLDGLGQVNRGEYGTTSPPLVVNDLVLATPGIRDGFRADAPGGVVRAWDVRTGKLVWAWDPVGPSMTPVTAEDVVVGGKTFTRGTPDAWGTLSADIEHGLIYIPTGHAPQDHFKGTIPGDLDYYGTSVVALDANTGKLVWHFQTVHRDVWDYDVGAQPALYEHEGKIPALAISTKMGHIFLLNRLTGAPLFPVEERPVPVSDIPGETISPTQPFPTLPKPLFSGPLPAEDLIRYPYFSKGCKETLASVRNEGIFTPPSLRGSLMYPGISGGFNWGSGSIDPATRTMITPYLNLPFIVKLVPSADDQRAEDDHAPFSFMKSPQHGSPFSYHRVPFVSEKGMPCIKPPWGGLLAIDLDTGKELWRKPLGSLNGRVPLIGSMMNVGMIVSGGGLQTASGLFFIGTSADGYLRAFDSATGKKLWSMELPFSAHAVPMTYRLRPESKQYLVVAAGGSASMNPKSGDRLIAFTLKD